MQRRKFLSLMSAAGITTVLGPAVGKTAPAASAVSSTDAVAVLHDSVRCIGCRKCEEACFIVNKQDLPQYKRNPEAPAPDFSKLNVLESPRQVSSNAYTVVNKYTTKDGKVVFRKQQCNHCMEPACATACYSNAFTKTPEGAVVFEPSRCVGCRYCLVACPYYALAFDYDGVSDPVVHKCTLCAPRIANGQLPGCVESCPTDALLFGKRSDLLRIAHQRIARHPELYENHIYGEAEVGGSSWLYLSSVPHNELGQPVLDKISALESASNAIDSGIMAAAVLPVLLGGAYAVSKRRAKMAEEAQSAAVKTAVDATTEAADAKLKAALAKAEKEQDAAVAREVKKAKEEAAKEFEEKLAAMVPAENAEAEAPADAEAPEKEEENA